MLFSPRRQSSDPHSIKGKPMRKLTLSLTDLVVRSFDVSPALDLLCGTVHGNQITPPQSAGCPSANCSQQATCPVNRTCGPTCPNVHTCGNDCL
jgi:hypothetical protein